MIRIVVLLVLIVIIAALITHANIKKFCLIFLSFFNVNKHVL